MKENDLNWYRENGFAEAVLSTAAEITAQVEHYYEMGFDEVFICNNLKNGQEEYPSLWLFTGQDAVECKNFLTDFNIDILRYKNNVIYINIMADNGEALSKPEQTSKMKVEVAVMNDARCTFEAYGMNCQKLSGIAKRFLKEYKSM